MDLSMFVNAGVAGGIIAILQAIKAFDTKGKLAKGFYILAALILGFLCGFIVTPYETETIQWLQKVAMNGIAYGGAASVLYQTGKLTLSQDTEKLIHK